MREDTWREAAVNGSNVDEVRCFSEQESVHDSAIRDIYLVGQWQLGCMMATCTIRKGRERIIRITLCKRKTILDQNLLFEILDKA